MRDNMDIPGETASADTHILRVDYAQGQDKTIIDGKVVHKCEMLKQWKVRECKMRKCPYYTRECDDL